MKYSYFSYIKKVKEVRGSSEGYPVYYFEFATKEKKLDETFK